MFYITSVSLVNCTNLHALCLTGCTWLQSLDCPVPTTHISCCYSIKKYDLFHIWGSCEHNAHLSLYFQLDKFRLTVNADLTSNLFLPRNDEFEALLYTEARLPPNAHSNGSCKSTMY